MHVHVAPGSILEHYGIQVQFVGVCALRNDPAATLEFISLVREVMPEGHLSSPASFDFEFLNVEKRFESYIGMNVTLRCAARGCPHPPYRPRPTHHTPTLPGTIFG